MCLKKRKAEASTSRPAGTVKSCIVRMARACAQRTALVVCPAAAPWPKSRPPVRRLWECGERGGDWLIKLCTLALSRFPYRRGTSDHTGGQNQELPSAAAFFSVCGGRDLSAIGNSGFVSENSFTSGSRMASEFLRKTHLRVVVNAPECVLFFHSWFRV